jgi:hypothetical protein
MCFQHHYFKVFKKNRKKISNLPQGIPERAQAMKEIKYNEILKYTAPKKTVWLGENNPGLLKQFEENPKSYMIEY